MELIPSICLSFVGQEAQQVSESISIPKAVSGAVTVGKNIFNDFTNSFKNIIFPKEDTVFDTILNRYDPPSLRDTLLNRHDSTAWDLDPNPHPTR